MSKPKRVKCKSGLSGWRWTLHENYDNDFSGWEYYSDLYGLTERLGFKTPQEAWKSNPVIEGSVDPSDFRAVRPRRAKLAPKS